MGECWQLTDRKKKKRKVKKSGYGRKVTLSTCKEGGSVSGRAKEPKAIVQYVLSRSEVSAVSRKEEQEDKSKRKEAKTWDGLEEGAGVMGRTQREIRRARSHRGRLQEEDATSHGAYVRKLCRYTNPLQTVSAFRRRSHHPQGAASKRRGKIPKGDYTYLDALLPSGEKFCMDIPSH
jgi:hypothetical protein